MYSYCRRAHQVCPGRKDELPNLASGLGVGPLALHCPVTPGKRRKQVSWGVAISTRQYAAIGYIRRPDQTGNGPQRAALRGNGGTRASRGSG